MGEIRKIDRIINGKYTSDGAGVKLRRVFGYHEVPLFDPFLLLDEFKSTNPDDYTAGFPWHPHRGIETVTYMVNGKVEHGDSLGNKGSIGAGDCQWMTAGSGIIHMEMPQKSEVMWGYQLWVNLPAKDKMTAPKYRDIRADTIPTVQIPAKGTVRILTGTYGGVKGPLEGISVEPAFLDVTLEPEQEFIYETENDRTLFAYIVDGMGLMEPDSKDAYSTGNAILFTKGDKAVIHCGAEGLRVLLISGKPLNEEVAWGGPIVMNTEEELETAFREYRNGTFIKT